ncbi:MAG: hypothetical protein KA362_14840 [Chloroflexi bacterium]|nr:hypothetical protein [Chloroflexota bacterium]MBK7175936.1 hypothetical protein [Chloroflexota bacterium]MBK7916541.1 hypothetical protein [Chloroflexota bacterium]MBP6805385.1 hypothetical protein [Chloroflexota bacterium]MBP7590092.1 hypothetical protein [Chloroflexota bacterium]
MASGHIRLNRRFFSEDKLRNTNPHRLSLDEKISRPTILRYLREDNVDTFSGDVLYAILVGGFGMSREQVEQLTVGELFEVVTGE